MGEHQRISPEQAARQVLDILIEQDGEPIKVADLMKRTRLTLGNTRKGIAHLRTELAELEGVSYISVPTRNGGIALTTDRNRADAYTRARARIARTQLNRVMTGTVRPMMRTATTKAAKREVELIEVQLQRLIEDLDRFAAV